MTSLTSERQNGAWAFGRTQSAAWEKPQLSSSQTRKQEQFCPATQAVVTSAKRTGDRENTNEQIRGGVEESVVLTSLIFFVWKKEWMNSVWEIKRESYRFEELEQMRGPVKEGTNKTWTERKEWSGGVMGAERSDGGEGSAGSECHKFPVLSTGSRSWKF